jgi:hypothetical protein
MSFHTDLGVILKPIEECIDNYKWIASDLELNTSVLHKLPINHDEDFFVLSSEDLNVILDNWVQVIWGVFIGVPKNAVVTIDDDNLPYVDRNPLIWKNGNLQHPDAKVEIICVDSGYTIVKFTEKKLSDKFKSYFNEAIELEKFR